MRTRLIISIAVLFICHASFSYAGSYISADRDSVKHTKAIAKKRKASNLPPFVELAKDHRKWHDDCTFTDKYTLNQRLKKYPFSKAAKVVAVSFHFVMERQRLNKKDILDVVADDTVTAPKSQSEDSKGFVEMKTLDKMQIANLTKIIFNTDFKKPEFNTVSDGGCYEPRNALLFYNDQGEIFDRLDICFQCKESHSKSDRITVGALCAQKYDLFRKFFIGLGIKTGTITE